MMSHPPFLRSFLLSLSETISTPSLTTPRPNGDTRRLRPSCIVRYRGCRARCDALKVMQINRAINGLDRIPTASEVPRGTRMEVCVASEEHWNAFVESEDQALGSKHMEWIDGRIYIVEFPGSAHDNFARAIGRFIERIPGTDDYLVPHEATHWADGPHYTPDESFGPQRQFAESLGVQLPAGIHNWGEFSTLKIEVGVSRGWGATPGHLDWKATRAWPRVPGVVYVLCIAADPLLQRASYKLYVLPDGARQRNNMRVIAQSIDIVAATPPVELDARRLLAIPPGVALTLPIPDPLAIDLFAAMQRGRFTGGLLGHTSAHSTLRAL